MLKRVRDSFRADHSTKRISDTDSGLKLHASSSLKEGLTAQPSGLERETVAWHKGGAASLARGEVLRRGTTGWAPWIGEDFYLCVNVKEALDLEPGVSLMGATCDPFVRVVLARPGSLPLAEAETRVILRNSHPLWEEWLPFSLDNVTEDMLVALRVMDKDIGHFISFCGMVSLPIKEVLSTITDMGEEVVYRMPLMDKSGTTRRPGVLVFGISILAKDQYDEMRKVITAIQDPDQIHAQLHEYQLHIKVHGVKGLAALGSGSAAASAGLALQFSLCGWEQREPLRCALGPTGEAAPDDLELVVPLGAAFGEGESLKGRLRDQYGEVRIDLLSWKNKLARTQVPIWDVPFKPDPIPAPEISEAARAAAAVMGMPGSLTGGLSGARPPPAASATAEPPATPVTGTAAASDANKSFLGAFACNVASAMAAVAGGSGTQAKDAPSSPTSPEPPAPPPPPPTPLWGGKRYIRRMEKLDKVLDKGAAGVSGPQKPELEVSMQLVRVADAEAAGADGGAGGGAAAGAVDWDAKDVDVPAEPLAAPAPHPHAACDYVVKAGPHELLRALYGPDAPIADKVNALEQMTDYKCGEWGPDPDGKALTQRTVSYLKPTPVGPTPVQSVQKVLVKGDGGWVVENRITPNVPPVGQCVHVFMLVVGQHVGAGKTRLTVSLRTEWFKSGMMVNVVKGKVESATPPDAVKFFNTLKTELAAKYGVEGGGGGGAAGAAEGGTAGEGAAAGTAAGGVAAVVVGGGAGGGALGGSPVLLLAIAGGLGLVLLLTVLVLLRVTSELGHSARAFEALTGALDALPSRLAAVAQQQALAAAQVAQACPSTAAAAAEAAAAVISGSQ
ncbi:hypothetical protein CHLRE_10g450850v5 [Chlamydomonas reinhardtii]|uniref:C2 domain-containing protein n=1 Tax=Chlamydomonas reinhardtii TaxID=3055 RepID=A0A2K3DB58_CHLRE|nr:uncharacterized protein CHLRE_10g450850v5 [Chlamydomonas reinhardtii]PNW77766.1 hypothetical protein CHLRE_10g450850v5 [Chlamydomonas reinhardtii]